MKWWIDERYVEIKRGLMEGVWRLNGGLMEGVWR